MIYNYIQEFAYVMASVTNYKGDPTDLINQKHSGLMNYLFGNDRTKEINKERFHQFQQDLMRDIFWLEFTRYSKDGITITDKDFCNHILLCANFTSKKKKHMVRVLLGIIKILIKPNISRVHCIFRYDKILYVLHPF